MKTLIVSLIAVTLLSGCCVGDNCRVQKIERNKTGEIRHELFKECLELAAKIERVGDDDVSDIISECDNVASYTANQLTK